MTENTSLDALLAEAGRLLVKVAGDAEFADEDDEGWVDGARTVREAYTRVQRTAPENLEAAVGLAVLTGAELRFHMVNHVDETWWEEGPPIVQVPDGDEAGRLLVDEAAGAARHVLSLDPDNNLAAYLEGLAHECGGVREEALRAYRRALELDPWDEIALTRAQELDDEYDPARYEGPDPNPHARHFWLLRSSERISNSGDERVLYRRLSDPADVRDAIESVLSDVEARNPDLARFWGTDEYLDQQDGGFDLITYAPGRPPTSFDVYDALRPASSGGLEVDWDAVDIDEPPPALRLPLGQPVRIDGRTYFHGLHEPVEE
ncbi:hypothetical protein [Actinoallomurus vinaceus]|uniref:hypothetical protein n=1 Tax=Actinoallomurus vinaceus TaxID=1080074 RepID=UPI0031EA2948